MHRRAFVLAFLAATLHGCGGSSGNTETTAVVTAVVDCTVANRDKVEALLAEFAPLLAGDKPDWKAVVDKAVDAGSTIGGCALADLAQRRAAPEAVSRSSSTAAPPTRSARSVFEEFRAEHAHGAVYRTAKGEL
jgi:hypothetical protein